MSYTAEQARAIDARSGELLLAANAGSGKTRVLVERVVRAVREDGCPVEGILAITFTDKAAGELRERVRRRFAELGDAEHARAVERAWISTIHGLCARVLRAHPVEAGVDPRFAVLDERRARRLASVAFGEALNACVDERGEPALALLAAYGADALQEGLLAAHGRLRSLGRERPRLPEPAVEPLAPAALDVAGARAAFAAELGAVAEPGKTVLAALDALERCADRLEDAATPSPDVVVALAPKGAGAALRTDAAGAYSAALERWRRACADHHGLALLAELDALLGAFDERLREHKRRRGVLDFEDLELRALRLLRERPAVRERLVARFEHVMVDEFQDTNPIQLELVRLLAGESVFLVGDAFQSIYRFRHADVGLFTAERERLALDGRAWTLPHNFRSAPEILDVLDATFAGAVFDERFTPLRAGLQGDDDLGEPRVELLVTDKEAWRDDDAIDLGTAVARASRWRVAEARLLAQRVRALLDAGARPDDVVVLLRATADLGLFSQALEDREVPTYVIGGRGFWSHQQVQDVVSYLAVLANAADEGRLYAVLASPLVGLSSDGMAAVAHAGREGHGAWAAIVAACAAEAPQWLDDLTAPDREALAALAERLPRHRELVARTPLASLIERVICDTGYDLEVLRRRGGQRRLANVRKLMRLAREHEASEGPDLRGFVEVVAELTEGEDREAEAPTESEQVGAVRLMTIHRAKGLEFPIVCVADLGREPPPDGRDLLRIAAGPGGELRLALKLPRAGGRSQHAFDHAELAAAEARADAEEERRLLYVALTRAERRLILSGACGEKDRGEPLHWLAGALAPGWHERVGPESPRASVAVEWEGRTREVAVALNRPDTVGAVLEERSCAPSPVAAPDAQADPPPAVEHEAAVPASPAPARLSYSALEAHARCGYRFYLQRVLRLPDEDPPGRRDGGGLDARTRGTLAHAALERARWAARSAPPVAQVARTLGVQLSGSDAERLDERVRGLLGGPVGDRLAAAGRPRPEQPFAFLLGGPGGALVTGALDVVADEPRGALVVDFKTDRVAAGADLEALCERDYAVQRRVYALAVLRAGAERVTVLHAFLERPDAPAQRTWTRDDEPELERLLLERAADLVAGRHAPTARPHADLCATCPGRRALCSWPEEMTLRPAAR